MYKTINGYTKQSMKDRIVLKNNGNRCIDMNGACTYSMDNDTNRCAVGCFIPDGHDGLDSNDFVNTLLVIYKDLSDEMPLSVDGMRMFQGVHDNNMGKDDIHYDLFKWIDENVIDSQDDKE